MKITQEQEYEPLDYAGLMRHWLWAQVAIKDAELSAAERAASGDKAGAILSITEDLTQAAMNAAILEQGALFPEPWMN